MSKLALSPADTGTGTITLECPVTNTNRTVNIPDATGTLPLPNLSQTWTGAQVSGVTTDNGGPYDMSVGNDFISVPSAALTLQFDNLVSGQRGCLLLDNSGGQSISLHASIKAKNGIATTLSTAGIYWISYWCYDGVNVAISCSEGLV